MGVDKKIIRSFIKRHWLDITVTLVILILAILPLVIGGLWKYGINV